MTEAEERIKATEIKAKEKIGTPIHHESMNKELQRRYRKGLGQAGKGAQRHLHIPNDAWDAFWSTYKPSEKPIMKEVSKKAGKTTYACV